MCIKEPYRNTSITFIFSVFVLTTLLTSCASYNRTMRGANTSVGFSRGDFVISRQVSAIASSRTVLGIDFKRSFGSDATREGKLTGADQETGGPLFNVGVLFPFIGTFIVPIIGNLVHDRTASYALYELLKENPGYDVVIYPQFETKIVRPYGLGFLSKITTVRVTARLGRLKSDLYGEPERSNLLPSLNNDTNTAKKIDARPPVAQLPLQPSIKLRDTLYPAAQLPLQPSIKLRDTLSPVARLPLQPSIKLRDARPPVAQLPLQPSIKLRDT
ncbi:MAG: hypothetical protein QM528_06910, partial [Phycisphaerales bacterium]|nr:hypothetical protein [Phycisphaerales bacterium]